MRAAGSELDDGLAAGGFDDAGGLGGDEGLEADVGQQERFRNLRFDQGRADDEDRLAGKQRRAFGNGEDIAGEAEGAQVVEEVRAQLCENWDRERR